MRAKFAEQPEKGLLLRDDHGFLAERLDPSLQHRQQVVAMERVG